MDGAGEVNSRGHQTELVIYRTWGRGVGAGHDDEAGPAECGPVPAPGQARWRPGLPALRSDFRGCPPGSAIFTLLSNQGQ
eukprot:768180-Hanusia_phi.AAC.4